MNKRIKEIIKFIYKKYHVITTLTLSLIVYINLYIETQVIEFFSIMEYIFTSILIGYIIFLMLYPILVYLDLKYIVKTNPWKGTDGDGT